MNKKEAVEIFKKIKCHKIKQHEKIINGIDYPVRVTCWFMFVRGLHLASVITNVQYCNWKPPVCCYPPKKGTK